MTESIPHYPDNSAAYPPPIDHTKYDAILAKVPDIGNIGICGSHGTGKTTLAKALSQRIGLPFVEIGTSAIFAEHHLDPALPMDFQTRLWIQSKILRHAESIWFEMDEPFICDRTPIDMMAYTLAEVRGDTLSQEMEWELTDYIEDCRKATEKYFSKLVLLPPVLPVQRDRVGKASSSRGYRQHIHVLCLGLFHESHVDGYMVNGEVKVFGDRVADVVRFLNV